MVDYAFNETATLEIPESDDFGIETMLGKVPDKELLRYEKLLDIKNTRIKFARDYHVNSRGNKMSWEFPHILDLYEEVSPKISIQGSTQCMKTEWIVCTHLAAMACGLNIFFVLHKHSMRTTYVANHVDRVIEMSPGYQAIAGGKPVGNKLKRFVKGATRYVSSNKRDEFIEFPSDCCHRSSIITMWGTRRNRPIKDVKIGDTVVAYDGCKQVPDKVVKVLCRGKKDILSVKTSDGNILNCTLGERFFTNSGWKYLYELVKDGCYEFCNDGSIQYVGSRSNGDDLRIVDGGYRDCSEVFQDRNTQKEFKQGLCVVPTLLSGSAPNRILQTQTQTLKNDCRKIYHPVVYIQLWKYCRSKICYKAISAIKEFKRHRLRIKGGQHEKWSPITSYHNSGVSRTANSKIVSLLVYGRRKSLRPFDSICNGLLSKIRSRIVSAVPSKVRSSFKEGKEKIKRAARMARVSWSDWNYKISKRYPGLYASRPCIQMGQYTEATSVVFSMFVGDDFSRDVQNMPTMQSRDDGVYRVRTGEVQTTSEIVRSRKTKGSIGETENSKKEIRSLYYFSKGEKEVSGELSSSKSREIRSSLRNNRGRVLGTENDLQTKSKKRRGETRLNYSAGNSSKKNQKSKNDGTSQKETKLLNSKGEWVDIVSIEYGSFDEVWDIQTEKHHNFYANDLLVHNCVIVDEWDWCDQNNLPYAVDRLGGSPFGFEYYIGNPTREGFGINEKYLNGDQRRWLVKCCACGKFRVLDWFRHVVRPVVTGKRVISDYKLRDTEWQPGMHRDLRAVCPCGGALDRYIGAWHALKPENYYLGGASYLLNALSSVQKNISEIYELFLPAITDFTRMENFYRSVLGLPYSPSDNKVSSSIINDAKIDQYLLHDDGLVSCVEGNEHKGPCFLGMDVGAFLDVSILYLNPRGTKILVYCGRLQTLDEVRDLIKRYNVRIAVVDRDPETSLVRDLQDTADCAVWLCKYSESAAGVSGGVRANSATMEILTDRTEHLDSLFKAIHSKAIRFPENYIKLLKGVWYSQMTASTRELKKNTKGQVTYKWSDSAADHQFHSLAYANLAVTMGGERVTVYVG